MLSRKDYCTHETVLFTSRNLQCISHRNGTQLVQPTLETRRRPADKNIK